MKKRIFAALMFLSVLSSHLHASVTNVRYFRLGESDLQHLSGMTAITTEDATGGSPMTLNGPQYSADVFNTLSSVSMVFSGGQHGTATLVDNLTANFGLELWVKPTSKPAAGSTRSIVYVGIPGVNGWGFIQNPLDGNLSVMLGGVTSFGSVNIPVNGWTHLALVCDTTTSTLYANGSPVATANALPIAPGANTNLRLAGDTNDSFAGGLDELRIFNFDENAFAITDLRYIPPFRLDIVKTANGQTLSWPSYYNRYFVETSTNMDASVIWTPLYNKNRLPGMIYMNRTDAESQRFYRLAPCGESTLAAPILPPGKYPFMTRNNGLVVQFTGTRISFNNGGNSSTKPTTVSVENFFDPYDPNCDGPAQLSYQWTLKTSGYEDNYTAAGITGTHSAVLTIQPNSMLVQNYDLVCDITSTRSGLITTITIPVAATGSTLTPAIYDSCQSGGPCSNPAALPGNGN